MCAAARARPKSTWGRALARFLEPHCAIVGLGNRLRGDDAFGPKLVEALAGRVPACLLDAGSAPENYLGQLVALDAGKVLFVDAGDIRREPGALAVLRAEELGAGSITTHAASPALLAGFLQGAIQAEVRFLLVQPGRVSGDDAEPASLSPPVQRALRRVAIVVGSIFGTVPASWAVVR